MQAPATAGTPELIAHIVDRFHETHRRELLALVAQAQALQVLGHAAGLAARLQAVAGGLELHMFKEEMRLFPMLEQGGNTLIGHLIQDLSEEHARDDTEVAALHADARAELSAVSQDANGDARTRASALLGLLDRFVADLAEHMRIEEEVLFARFRVPGKV